MVSVFLFLIIFLSVPVSVPASVSVSVSWRVCLFICLSVYVAVVQSYIYCSRKCQVEAYKKGVKTVQEGVTTRSTPHKHLCASYAAHMQYHAQSNELQGYFPWLVITKHYRFAVDRVLERVGIIGQKGYWVNMTVSSPHALQSSTPSSSPGPGIKMDDRLQQLSAMSSSLGAGEQEVDYSYNIRRRKHVSDEEGWCLPQHDIPTLLFSTTCTATGTTTATASNTAPTAAVASSTVVMAGILPLETIAMHLPSCPADGFPAHSVPHHHSDSLFNAER